MRSPLGWFPVCDGGARCGADSTGRGVPPHGAGRADVGGGPTLRIEIENQNPVGLKILKIFVVPFRRPEPMKHLLSFLVVLSLLAPVSALGDTIVLLCTGKSYLSFERDGIPGAPRESDVEMVIRIEGDRMVRGELSADCSKTEREIRCSASTPDLEHSSTLNRYTGRMTLVEKLRTSVVSSTFSVDAKCSPAAPKF